MLMIKSDLCDDGLSLCISNPADDCQFRQPSKYKNYSAAILLFVENWWCVFGTTILKLKTERNKSKAGLDR